MTDDLLNSLATAIGTGPAIELKTLLDSLLPVGATSPQTVASPLLLTAEENVQRVSYTLNSGHLADGSDYEITAGWGDSAVLSVIDGTNDTRGTIIVTSGTANFAANPTITLTFRDGTWGVPPFAVVCRSTFTDQLSVPVTVETTATTMIITFLGTPSANETYFINFFVRG